MSNVRVINAPFEELRAASAANGGTALTTTLALVALPENSDWVSCIAHNFVGALVARLSFNPWLTIVRTANLLGSEGTDISAELQDGDTTDVAMDAFTTIALSNALYVGSWLPFRGVRVTQGSDPQNTASVLTVKYWNGSAWTAVSGYTDGTISGGATFAITGNVIWTVPTDWTLGSLRSIGEIGASANLFNANFLSKGTYIAPLYWTRWEVSAATEATWNVVGMQPLNRSTAYAEYPEGFGVEMAADVGPNGKGLSCVEALVDAGTGNLVVNVATKPDTADRRLAA